MIKPEEPTVKQVNKPPFQFTYTVQVLKDWMSLPQ